jgi:glycosyltransferase involved in cell wall biosynthesis
MRLVFVTDRRDAHVSRFSEAFAGFGVDYEYVGVRRTGADVEADIGGATVHGWKAVKEALAAVPSVVISGPLDTVTSQLAGGDYRHVGISWATDVMATSAASLGALRTLRSSVATLDLVVVDNYSAENALISLGISPEAICRIPWGPESGTSQESTRSELGVPEGAFVLVYPRSHESHYQPEVFVEALAGVVASRPDVIAVMVESGSLVEATKRDIEARGLGAHVVWQPLRSPQEFGAVMALADVVVVTTRTDGTSVTVMDAMHRGVAVVSSLTNGSAEWVLDGVTGWTFPVGNSVALSEALLRMVALGPEERAEITANARRLVDVRAGWARSVETLSARIQKLFTF